MESNINTGFIGFFDILGYQNLLEKNEPENIIETVIERLENTPADAKKVLFSNLSKISETTLGMLIEKYLADINYNVFSDTILLTVPDHHGEIPSELKSTLFISYCIALHGLMFDIGLPLRGVINFGKYLIKNQCFAGRSIIEAYKIVNDLELSATVLTEEAVKQIKNIHTSLKEYPFIVQYLVPRKSRETEMFVISAHTYKNPNDIKGDVLNSFCSHNKDIPSQVWKKVTNTENWLRYLKMKRPLLKNNS